MEVNENRFNKGTTYGRGIIAESLKELGCGRSVLADRNDVILCGNEVFSIAQELGMKIRVIETTGDELIVVKRTDVDAKDKKGLELALVDNLSQEHNLEWDNNNILSAMDENINFDPRKWGGYDCIVKELNIVELLQDCAQSNMTKQQTEESFQTDNQLSLFTDL